MIVRFLIFTLSVGISPLLIGQDLEDGFLMLENGKYHEATQLFSEILKRDATHKTARICYARALGLGGSAPEAYQLFLNLKSDFPDDVEVDLNLAESLLWNLDFDSAIQAYESILEREPTNFVANYGFANAQAGLFNNDVALKYIDRAIKIDSTNAAAHNSRRHILLSKAYLLYKSSALSPALDVLDLLNSEDDKAQAIRMLIDQKSTSEINGGYTYSWDLGGFKHRVKNIGFDIKVGDRNKLGLHIADRKIENSNTLSSGQQQSMLVVNKMSLGPIFQLTTGLGIYSNKVKGEQLNTILAKRGSLEGFWGKRLYTDLSYKNEVHSYSPQLLQSNIALNHYALAINYNFSPSIGMYNKTLLTYQSDSNKSQVLFSSLYLTLLKQPLLRIGVNNNLMTYAEQSALYFSPGHFHSYEGFLLVNNENSNSSFGYSFLIGIGQQKIEQESLQLMRRIDTYVSYAFKHNINLKLKYQYNNTAQATAIGRYSFNQLSLTVSYVLSKKL